MCITFLSVGHSKAFPLIIVHNRDEIFSRTASPLQKIDTNTSYDIYGGIDLKANGMWIGVTNTGKVGYITSYRDRSKWNDTAKSRGILVKAYLEGTSSAQEYLTALSTEVDEFNPFNLVLGTVDELYYWNSNHRQIVHITNGCHTLSNAYLDTPWFKTSKLLRLMEPLCSDYSPNSALFSSVIQDPTTANASMEFTKDSTIEASSISVIHQQEGSFDVLENAILEVLLDSEKQPDISQLPKTGLTVEQEHIMSSIFIDTPTYGTVSSTIVMVSASGVVRVAEYSHSAGTAGRGSTRKVVEFPLCR